MSSRRPLSIPSAPFFNTPQQRVALARERFFEEGVRPSGLVSESVIQSWTRCTGARRGPDEPVDFDPITKARVAATLARNRQLMEAAQEDLSQLDAALAGTRCKAILTSHDGVIVHATPSTSQDGRLIPIIARVGVDLSESNIGTGAPGVAARTGEVCVVLGGEHFFTGIDLMYCAAAPIRNARGDIAAVLDFSSEAEMFRFDAVAMAQLYATGIENRLFEAQSRDHLLLRFQASPALLRTPLEGLAAINEQGRVLWFNGSGASLLGCERVPASNARAAALIGLDVDDLLVLAHEGRPRLQRLPCGLALWMEASVGKQSALTAGETGTLPVEPASPPVDPSSAPSGGETLRDVNRQHIESTLAECKGNISRTARRLGVSRGLLYRRLKDWGLA